MLWTGSIGNEKFSEWQKFRKIIFFQKLFHAIVEKHANCSRDCALTCKSYQFIHLFSDEGTTYDFLCSPTWLVGTWHALPDQISAPSWSLYTPLKHTAHWSKICTLWILCRIFLPSPLPGTMVAHWTRSWLTLACSSRSDFSPSWMKFNPLKYTAQHTEAKQFIEVGLRCKSDKKMYIG